MGRRYNIKYRSLKMDDIPLEFTTTATCRSSLIDRTYNSFHKNLTGVDWKKSTLYVNIDPIGGECEPSEIIKICQNYFGNVVYNLPKTCNFCAGHKWTWQQPTGQFFFTLQEDWVLKIPVSIRALHGKLSLNGDFESKQNRTVIVTLRAYSTIKDTRVCLSPGMVMTRWAKYIAEKMDTTKNPEKQCRPWTGQNIVGKNRTNYIGLQHPPVTRAVMVIDTGRDWMIKNGWHRPGGQGAFTFIHWKKNKLKNKSMSKPKPKIKTRERSKAKPRIQAKPVIKPMSRSKMKLKIKPK